MGHPNRYVEIFVAGRNLNCTDLDKEDSVKKFSVHGVKIVL